MENRNKEKENKHGIFLYSVLNTYGMLWAFFAYKKKSRDGNSFQFLITIKYL